MDSRVAQLLAGGEVVLDAGCGDGMALDAIAGRYRIVLAGFRDVKTKALIGTGGRLWFPRSLLDRWAPAAPVKNFLSANTLLVEVK